jgi:hypothetical protein
MREIVCKNKICILEPKKTKREVEMANIRGNGSYGLLPFVHPYEILLKKRVLQTRHGQSASAWGLSGSGLQAEQGPQVQLGGGSYGISPTTVPYQIPLQLKQKRKRDDGQRGGAKRRRTANSLTSYLQEHEGVGTYGIFPINDHDRPPLEYINHQARHTQTEGGNKTGPDTAKTGFANAQQGAGSYGISPLPYTYEIPLERAAAKKPRKYKKRAVKFQSGKGPHPAEDSLPEQVGTTAPSLTYHYEIPRKPRKTRQPANKTTIETREGSETNKTAEIKPRSFSLDRDLDGEGGI